MNAFSRQVQEELKGCAEEAARRSDVRAVVVYGGEKVFAAGADIKEMAGMSYAEMAPVVRRLSACFGALSEIPKPTVAAITGYALGGGMEVALGCDRRVCADNAKLGQPEILLGVIPGGGGTQRMARLIGAAADQGPDLHRADGRGGRGAGDRAGGPAGAGGRGLRHGPGLGRPVRRTARRWRWPRPRRRSTAGWTPTCAPGWTWRRSCSRRCSAPRTAASAWSRSWPTGRARPSSPAAERRLTRRTARRWAARNRAAAGW